MPAEEEEAIERWQRHTAEEEALQWFEENPGSGPPSPGTPPSPVSKSFFQ